MKTIRVIPCLDFKDGRVVKGVNFVNLKDAGDPVECAEAYCRAGADEIAFLDISATVEGRKTALAAVKRIAKAVTVPFAVGGGIASVADAESLFEAGVSKVSVNTAAVKKPSFIEELAKRFGSDKIILAVDAVNENNKFMVVVSGGMEKIDLEAPAWAHQGQELGAGEILLTSKTADGAKTGYDLDMLKAVRQNVTIPITASGGAGKLEHFLEAVKIGGADAVLAASLFHFGEITINEVKEYLKANM